MLSLAIGIGANTAVFSLVDTVLLKMLPVKNPEELVVLKWGASKGLDLILSYASEQTATAHGGWTTNVVSWPIFSEMRTRSRTLDAVHGIFLDARDECRRAWPGVCHRRHGCFRQLFLDLGRANPDRPPDWKG